LPAGSVAGTSPKSPEEVFEMVRRIGIVVALVVALVVVWNTGAQGPAKGKLPQYWSKLGLSDAQKAEVYKISGDYDKQILDHETKVKTLKAEKKAKLYAVLTDAQKEALKKILAEKAGEPAKDKKPPEKDK
jgi:hypothetical protein